MTVTSNAAWSRVATAENAGQSSLAADRAGAITGELYETAAETRSRELRQEREYAVSQRPRTALNVARVGTAVEVSGLIVDFSRPEFTRLPSAVRGAFEELSGCATAAGDFDEPDCVAVELEGIDLEALASALRRRGYTTVTVGGESWAEQITRISEEHDGMYPLGGGSEARYERDLRVVLSADFPEDGPTMRARRR